MIKITHICYETQLKASTYNEHLAHFNECVSIYNQPELKYMTSDKTHITIEHNCIDRDEGSLRLHDPVFQHSLE